MGGSIFDAIQQPEALATAGSQFFTTKPDGLGVGLVIVRNIAKLHGGELTVGNALKGGGVVVLRYRFA